MGAYCKYFMPIRNEENNFSGYDDPNFRCDKENEKLIDYGRDRFNNFKKFNL